LGARRQDRNLPFVAVCSVEAKVAVLVVREGISCTCKQSFPRSCAIRAHVFASSLNVEGGSADGQLIIERVDAGSRPCGTFRRTTLGQGPDVALQGDFAIGNIDPDCLGL